MRLRESDLRLPERDTKATNQRQRHEARSPEREPMSSDELAEPIHLALWAREHGQAMQKSLAILRECFGGRVPRSAVLFQRFEHDRVEIAAQRAPPSRNRTRH